MTTPPAVGPAVNETNPYLAGREGDAVDRRFSRRGALRRGALLAGGAMAGCVGGRRNGPLLTEGFESGTDGWKTAASIGPEEPVTAFEWRIERSDAQAAEGEWSLGVFTEGAHDDGTAWATRELSPPAGADAFEVGLQAWSESESFNTLRHLVAYLGPERPADEADFPDPDTNSTGEEGSSSGGLREPLHLAEGWREYTFRWQPDDSPETLYLAVGVSVVWEADATHYVDTIEVTAE